MATEQKHLLFIKGSGTLIAMMDAEADISGINTETFDIRTVDLDLDEGEFWHGDFNTGEIRKKGEKPLILESQLKYNTNAKILEEYPIHKQLNIIIDMLANSDITKTPEFTALKEYLDAARTNHNDQVSAYASNPGAYTFVSTDDDKAQASAVRNFE